MFAEYRPFPDQTLFAQSVEQRLNRGWSVRRSLIGFLGLGGGVVAVAQVAGTNLVDRAAAISHASMNVAEKSAVNFPQLAASVAQAMGLKSLPFGGEVIWLVVGLLAMAGAFLATRVMEEI